MRRTLTILAATAVAAAVAIPALAQSGGGEAQDPALARFTACLSAHGVDVPAGLGGVELKQWLGARQDDETIGAALKACAGDPDGGASAGAAKLHSCLTDHGVDVGGSPLAVKQKVAELSQTADGRATLDACGIHMTDDPAPGTCGSGKPAPPPGDQPTDVPKKEGT